MAVKYLDKRASGNDDGASIVNAYPTWALAKADVAAGDVIYIAPGTEWTIKNFTILHLLDQAMQHHQR